MKNTIPLFEVINKRSRFYGRILQCRQWSGLETMYEAEINDVIYSFHINELKSKNMKITNIIEKPTWGKTLQLLQEKGTLRINSSDSETFENLLNSINLKYFKQSDEESKLTRFTLIK